MSEFKWNLQEIFINSQAFYDEIENIKILLNKYKTI